MLDRYPKLIPIDKEPNHQIVHVFGLGKRPLERIFPPIQSARTHVQGVRLNHAIFASEE